MEKVEFWPPYDDWTLVIVTWDEVMNHPYYPIREILKWVDEYQGGKYQLCGYNKTDGFEFRFERPEDAVFFKLKWL